MDLTPVWLTLRLAAVATAILLLLGTAIAWPLARARGWWKPLAEAAVALPLVLPPTVLGFYLLLLLGARGSLGKLWALLGGEPLVFSFSGLVVGSVVFSLPFAVQPLQGAFEAIGNRPLEVAATLRAGPAARFFAVALPMARRGYLTAATLCFAHTVGEFGVVLMIGGNIPGETQVVSIALYDLVERMRYGPAHALAAGLVLFSFAVLAAVYLANRRWTAA